MQLHRIALYARLHHLHPAGPAEAHFWETVCLSLYLAQTMLATVMSVFGKLAGLDGIGFFELVFFRNAAMLILTIPLLIAGHINPAHHLRHPLDPVFGLLLLRGLLGFLSLSAWYLALSLLPLSDANALSFLSPAFVAVLAPVVLKEPTPRGVWYTLPLSLLGMLCVAQPSWVFGSASTASGSSLGIAVGLLQACFSTGSKLSIRALSLHHEPLPDILFSMAFISAACSFIGIVIMPGAMTMPQAPRTWGYLGAVALLGFTVQIMFTAAMQQCNAAKVAIFDYVSLLWTLVADYAVFGYLPSPLSLLGAGIIVVASIASMLISRKQQQDAAGEAKAGAAAAEALAVQLSKLKQYGSTWEGRSGKGRGSIAAASAREVEQEALGLLGAMDAGTGADDEGQRHGSDWPGYLQPQQPQPQPQQWQQEEVTGGWRLGTELAEVAPGLSPTRTSTEKEAALQQAGR